MNENGKATTGFFEESDHPQFFSPIDENYYRPMEYLVRDLIPKGHPVMFFGDGGSLKSITTQHLGISLSSSEVDTWLGKKIPTLPVLNLEYEQSKEEHTTRAIQIIRGLNIDTPPIEFLSTMDCAGSNFWDTVPEILQWADENCYQENRDGVLMLDSLGYALPGKLEDQETAIGFYNQFLVPLKKYRVTPIIVHHTPKYSKVPYGSVYLVRNNFRSQWRLEDMGTDLPDSNSIRMEDTKRNYSGKRDDLYITGLFSDEDTPEEEKAIWITRKTTGDIGDLINKRPSDKEQIIQDLVENGSSTRDMISERTGLKYNTVKARISELLNAGEVIVSGKSGRKESISISPERSKGTGPSTLPVPNFSPNEEEVRSTPSYRTSGHLDLTRNLPGPEVLERYSMDKPLHNPPKFENTDGETIRSHSINSSNHPWIVVDDSDPGTVILERGDKDSGVSSKEGSENTNAGTYAEKTFLSDPLSKDQERREVRNEETSEVFLMEAQMADVFEDIGSHTWVTREKIAERIGIELNIVEEKVSELMKEGRIYEIEIRGQKILDLDCPW